MNGTNNFRFGSIDLPSGFSSFEDYEATIELLEASADATEIPIQRSVGVVDIGLNERWFKSSKTGETVRVVEPDAPYPGACSIVS